MERLRVSLSFRLRTTPGARIRHLHLLRAFPIGGEPDDRVVHDFFLNDFFLRIMLAEASRLRFNAHEPIFVTFQAIAKDSGGRVKPFDASTEWVAYEVLLRGLNQVL
jgi:hypothetical protein